MDQHDHRPTLAQVAERARVSLKTASRAVNGEAYVREETRARVLAAAGELGFHVNSAASILARGLTSNVVGLVTGDLSNPFYASLAKGLESELRGHGLQLSLSSSDEDAARETAIVEELARRHVRAIVVVSTMDSHERYASLQTRGIPLIFVDRAAQGLTAPSVVFDDRAGTAEATRHLIAHGHRDIAFLGDYAWLPTFTERLAGFEDAMRGRGSGAQVRDGAHDIDTASRLTAELLDSPHPPTAFFASNNRATIGALQEFRRRDATPALVGFDDFDLAAYIGVTVVATDPVEMGRCAARLALGLEEARKVVLPTRLVVRGSGERVGPYEAPLG